MEALGVIGFVLGLIALGLVEKLKKDVAEMRTELDELRGNSGSASAPESK